MQTKQVRLIMGICIIGALVLLCFLFRDMFGGTVGEGTALEFRASSSGNEGFVREAVVYTEDGATYVNFDGKISTDGTAEISLVSEDGTVVFSDTYTAVNSKKLDIQISDLIPQSYYTLRFMSNDSKSGHLFLTTEQALVERPEIPERPERTPPTRSGPSN